MPSESVWFEEVDTALLGYIQSVVLLPSSYGGLFPVSCFVRKPDEDFKVEQYPSITIYNVSSIRDDFRYYPEPVVVSCNAESKTLVAERSAIPYVLTYQIDFWSRLQSDMNEMTRLWFSNIPERYFNLPVLDKSRKPRSCFALQSGNLVKSDFLDGTARTFHSTITYKINVELDERISEVEPLVTEVQEIISNQVNN